MVDRSLRNDTELARALLNIVPRLLQRIVADVPLDEEASDEGPGLREVTELRATPGQLTLLSVLVEHERCTMQELAEHLAVAPSTVTAMVKRLLAQGYVERGHDHTDWRCVWVKPTESGRLVVSIYYQARLASLQRRLSHLDGNERASILAALPALRHLIEI